MCGIAGVIGQRPDRQALNAMLATMARRGPDGNGIYEDGECVLLHARLSVIDPEGGKQPMTLRWAGECYTLVYNGELYNTEEIRRELIRRGHSFIGHSDTEVVLHAYGEYGPECLQYFNGIYAFGVWSSKRRQLFLARDRIGVKPLFYTCRGKDLVFASEIKTLLQCPGIKAALDREGAAQLLLLGPGRTPGSGVFHNIWELEPGCCALMEGGKLSVTRYWRLEDGEHPHTFEETAEYIRYLLTDAIKRQLVSDVPIGAFLSGGLDSSLICAVCAGEMGERGGSLTTFSVDYRNNDRYFQANKFQPDSDNTYIDIMRAHIRSDHTGVELTPEDLFDALEAATEARDLPGMADVDFSLLAFCGEIRKKVTVALSGECADEIFGGYPWYRDPEVRAKAGFPWAQNTAQRSELLNDDLKRQLDPEGFIMDRYLQTVRESQIGPWNTEQDRQTKQMVNLNFRWFMQTLLDRKDRMSMYRSLEVRVPFCDHRIAEYMYRVPWEMKDYRGREKGLLRYAMKGILPEQVLNRKKSPYPKTFDPQYEKLVAKRLQEVLERKGAALFALVDPIRLKSILEGESRWPWYGQLMRRPQMMAYFLQLDHWLEHYSVEILY